MDIAQEVRNRIVASANQLYEQAGRADFPTVDAVRRHAKVDMNAASTVMKEWRRMQTATPAPVAVVVPDRLRQVSDAALASLWAEAQEIANEALRAAQASWDAERAEAEAIREQVASAFQAQAVELDAATARVAELEKALGESVTRGDSLAERLDQQEAATQAATHRAELAEQHVEQIEQRAADLKAELDRAHADVDRLRTERDQAAARADQATATAAATAERADALRDELATVKAKAAAADQAQQEHKQAADAAIAERDQLRATLAGVQAKAEAAEQAHQEQRKTAAQEAHRVAERLTKAQADRDAAVKEAGLAREDAANLRGQLETLQTQHARVMQMLGDKKPAKGQS